MLTHARNICSWISVFLVLVAGQMQGLGLVFCSGCENGPGIELSELDGTCSSCHHEDSGSTNAISSQLYLDACGCIDQTITFGEFASQQTKSPIRQIQFDPNQRGVYIQSVLQERFFLKPHDSFFSLTPSSLSVSKSVVLRI